MTTPKQPNKSYGGSARNILRGVGGMGMLSGPAAPVGGSMGTPAKGAQNAGGSDGKQQSKVRDQNTKTRTIQARKAPGA
jgi:hypothetical protein